MNFRCRFPVCRRRKYHCPIRQNSVRRSNELGQAVAITCQQIGEKSYLENNHITWPRFNYLPWSCIQQLCNADICSPANASVGATRRHLNRSLARLGDVGSAGVDCAGNCRMALGECDHFRANSLPTWSNDDSVPVQPDDALATESRSAG